MTIRYRLFGIPKNLEELLELEKLRGGTEVKMNLYESSWYEEMGFSEYRYKMTCQSKTTGREVTLKKYKASSGLCGAGN